MITNGDQVRKLLKPLYPGREAVVDEFVDEAEHQEGEAVWLELYSADEQTIKDDFELYVNSRSH